MYHRPDWLHLFLRWLNWKSLWFGRKINDSVHDALIFGCNFTRAQHQSIRIVGEIWRGIHGCRPIQKTCRFTCRLLLFVMPISRTGLKSRARCSLPLKIFLRDYRPRLPRKRLSLRQSLSILFQSRHAKLHRLFDACLIGILPAIIGHLWRLFWSIARFLDRCCRHTDHINLLWSLTRITLTRWGGCGHFLFDFLFTGDFWHLRAFGSDCLLLKSAFFFKRSIYRLGSRVRNVAQ